MMKLDVVSEARTTEKSAHYLKVYLVNLLNTHLNALISRILYVITKPIAKDKKLGSVTLFHVIIRRAISPHWVICLIDYHK